MSPLVSLKVSDFSASRIAVVTSSRRLDLAKARKQLGYEPLFTLKQGRERTLKHFKHLQKL